MSPHTKFPWSSKATKLRGGWDADGCTITNISHISGRWLILFWFHLYKIKWIANERTTNVFLIRHLHLLHSIIDIEWMNVWCSMVVVPLMEVERVRPTIKNNGRSRSGRCQVRKFAAEKRNFLCPRALLSWQWCVWIFSSGEFPVVWGHCCFCWPWLFAIYYFYAWLENFVSIGEGKRWCSEALRVHKLSLYLNLKL